MAALPIGSVTSFATERATTPRATGTAATASTQPRRRRRTRRLRTPTRTRALPTNTVNKV